MTYGEIESVRWGSGRISNHEATDTFSGSELTASRSLVCQTLVRWVVVQVDGQVGRLELMLVDPYRPTRK